MTAMAYPTLQASLRVEATPPSKDLQTASGFAGIVGRSPALQQVLHRVEQVAPTDATVLILGETGTGKELLARALHRRGRRQARPLVTVNCAALPGMLIESELFGHEKGAFTGAVSRQLGRFELADGGTLLLDEIGELPLELQAKLLRVLQEGAFERLGASATRKVNVRVLAATNRDLAQAVCEGRFRADLYYRLNVFPLRMPPLRERREDIPLLVWSYIRQSQLRLGKRIERVPPRLMAALTAYAWPGNVRQLHNVLEHALIMSPGPTLVLDERELAATPHLRAAGQTLAEVERAHICSVLEACAWRIKGESQAAERLGLKPSTLRSRMKKLGIVRPTVGEASMARGQSGEPPLLEAFRSRNGVRR
jgi:transcriptional regulator with GAF, ATPase, and Fis domain